MKMESSDILHFSKVLPIVSECYRLKFQKADSETEFRAQGVYKGTSLGSTVQQGREESELRRERGQSAVQGWTASPNPGNHLELK